ncbi:MAG TPA: histidine kinase [Vicinamibacterales bacterium]|nr:histidine kinase [Vicinamibacterales bacterium]
MQNEPRPPEEVLLVTLLVKLAVTAVVATMLARFRLFRRILLTERRDWPERLVFAAGFGIPLTAGVAARIVLHYDAADLTLSGSFLTGLIAGPYSGALVGASVAIPALIHQEWGALPFAVGCGFAGGGLREICPKPEIWKITPFFFTRIVQSIWRQVRTVTLDWQLVLVTAPVLLEMLRLAIANRFNPPAGAQVRLFALQTNHVWLEVLILLGTVMAVAIPIKIWNSARIEHRLAEQEHLLMVARVDALANQINPHFLFNTLTSISSLIRSQPETARVLIVKLSALLRRLLRSQEHFVTLREELEAVDEYLDIERIRFGPSLVIDKRIDETTLEVVVPSMILQPLVENSIKHGLGRKLGEGRITIRSARSDGSIVIEVMDNGVGLPQTRMEAESEGGIGLRNVNERLRVIYGAPYQLQLHSLPGEGTSARIEIPETVTPDRATA